VLRLFATSKKRFFEVAKGQRTKALRWRMIVVVNTTISPFVVYVIE